MGWEFGYSIWVPRKTKYVFRDPPCALHEQLPQINRDALLVLMHMDGVLDNVWLRDGSTRDWTIRAFLRGRRFRWGQQLKVYIQLQLHGVRWRVDPISVFVHRKRGVKPEGSCIEAMQYSTGINHPLQTAENDNVITRCLQSMME